MGKQNRELEDKLNQLQQENQTQVIEIENLKRKIEEEIDRLMREINEVQERNNAELEAEKETHKKVKKIKRVVSILYIFSTS